MSETSEPNAEPGGVAGSLLAALEADAELVDEGGFSIDGARAHARVRLGRPPGLHTVIGRGRRAWWSRSNSGLAIPTGVLVFGLLTIGIGTSDWHGRVLAVVGVAMMLAGAWGFKK